MPKLTQLLVLAFLSIGWAGVHLYLERRLVRPLFAEGPRRRAATLALWSLVPLGPLTFLVSPLTGSGWADAMQRIGYIVMGLTSIVVAFALARDLLTLVVVGFARAVGRPLAQGRRELLARLSAAAVLGVSGALTAIGYFRARRLAAVESFSLAIPGLPEALDGLRITQVSDIHIGPFVQAAELADIVARVNETRPDLVAITGDLVDGSVERIGHQLAPLEKLRSTHGTYFCTGNHEYYSGVDAWREEVTRRGVRCLSQEHVIFERGGARVLVAGVDDPEAERFVGRRPRVADALEGAGPRDLSILLAHRPTAVDEASTLGVDLQLSGHTHAGQYFPYTLVVKLVQPYVAGLHRVRDTVLYVNRGTTYWGPPIRLGAAQEITVITLRRA